MNSIESINESYAAQIAAKRESHKKKLRTTAYGIAKDVVDVACSSAIDFATKAAVIRAVMGKDGAPKKGGRGHPWPSMLRKVMILVMRSEGWSYPQIATGIGMNNKSVIVAHRSGEVLLDVVSTARVVMAVRNSKKESA